MKYFLQDFSRIMNDSHLFADDYCIIIIVFFKYWKNMRVTVIDGRFQARCVYLQSCQITLRILRDIRKRVASWKPLTDWASLFIRKEKYFLMKHTTFP